MSRFYRFRVSGRVQGVGFRQAPRHAAESLGLRAWVQNCRDGSVEGAASGGGSGQLARFHAWLEQGPPAAVVDAAAWEPATPEPGLQGFAIRRG